MIVFFCCSFALRDILSEDCELVTDRKKTSTRFLLCDELFPTMRYAVLVTGPAGAGKSTFTGSLMTHLQHSKRTAHLVNLDPAAAPDSFEYAPSIDIKDLISLEDVMTELNYGPNGGLVYCFE